MRAAIKNQNTIESKPSQVCHISVIKINYLATKYLKNAINWNNLNIEKNQKPVNFCSKFCNFCSVYDAKTQQKNHHPRTPAKNIQKICWPL